LLVFHQLPGIAQGPGHLADVEIIGLTARDMVTLTQERGDFLNRARDLPSHRRPSPRCGPHRETRRTLVSASTAGTGPSDCSPSRPPRSGTCSRPFWYPPWEGR